MFLSYRSLSFSITEILSSKYNEKICDFEKIFFLICFSKIYNNFGTFQGLLLNWLFCNIFLYKLNFFVVLKSEKFDDVIYKMLCGEATFILIWIIYFMKLFLGMRLNEDNTRIQHYEKNICFLEYSV